MKKYVFITALITVFLTVLIGYLSYSNHLIENKYRKITQSFEIDSIDVTPGKDSLRYKAVYSIDRVWYYYQSDSDFYISPIYKKGYKISTTVINQEFSELYPTDSLLIGKCIEYNKAKELIRKYEISQKYKADLEKRFKRAKCD